MIINPWKAPKWNPEKKRKPKPQIGKLLCPFCGHEHRTIEKAAVCAREVAKYGSVEMRGKFSVFEAQWWERHPQLRNNA